MLMDGNIGVSATLGYPVDQNEIPVEPDMNNPSHRILLLAYYNALLNINALQEESGDIFDIIKFDQYHSHVMVGLFRPLLGELHKHQIFPVVFDNNHSDNILTPQSELSTCLNKADMVILSATSVINMTFSSVLSEAVRADVFVLGPSTLMYPDIYQSKNIKCLFGSVFNSHDEELLSIIESGGGTRSFSGRMQKRCIPLSF